MALQLHKLFASRISVMSHCRALQNYPGISLPCSSQRNVTKLYGNFSQLKFGRAEGTCSMTTEQFKDLGCMGQSGSCFPTSGYRNVGAATFTAQLLVSMPYTMKHKSFVSFSCMETRVNVLSRRFFSVKPTQDSQTQGNSMNMNSKVTVGDVKTGGSFKHFNKYRKKTKTLVARSSSSDGCSQVAVSTESVKKAVSHTQKSVSDNTSGVKPEEQAIGSGKKDEKKNSSVSAVSQSGSNNQGPKAEGKKQKQKYKKHVKPSVSTAHFGEAKPEPSKQSPRGPKAEGKQKQQKNLKQVKPSVYSIPSGEANAEVSELSARASPLLMKRSKLAKRSSRGKNVQVNRASGVNALKPLYPPTGKSVVVVESLMKAKTIQGYLGDMFEVLPSYGHVRDLAGRSGSVRPDDDFSVVWEVPAAAWTHLKSIKVALNGAKNLILASDPDREGEAIAWHIMEMLQQQEALHENITVSRVVFHEITESSIKSSLQNPRTIDANLVNAYLARRALDYLIGFSISPLLWRKLPACQSAGRVQSAALALICDKEMEIDEFKPQEYWTVEVEFNKNDTVSLNEVISIPSHLTHCASKRLEQLSISSHGEAKKIDQRITSSSFEVLGSKRSKARKNPPPPYITSTLQQDAAYKLQFSPSTTMKLAQKLYEGVKISDDEATGLITYMRTDGLHVSDVAAKDIRSLAVQRYGNDYASQDTRKYFKKVKNTREAHEAIRPTNIRRLPSMLTEVLDEDCLKLYTLIWSRTMACQMEPCVIDQIQVDIGSTEKFLVFRSKCSRVEFLGYHAVFKDSEVAGIGYNEKERDSHENVFKFLGKLKLGDLLQLGKVELKQHSTQPPSRYSEGSLVKKLEELGIGRPSTYASTIKVLKDRNYVTTQSQVLYPEFRGRMLSAFLSHHFSEVTDYSFIADMETELDNVSAGMTEWKGLLRDYWTRFSMYCENAGNLDVRQVEKMLEESFGHLLFASLPDKSRLCPSCLAGTLIFKVTKLGAGYFIGCDQHPKCKYTAKMMMNGDDEDDDTPERIALYAEPKLLGIQQSSGEKVLLKNGPYGFYVQLGEDRKGSSPKRACVSHIKDVGAITLEVALDLLRYPIILGKHPEEGSPVYLRLAKYGFAIKHRRVIAPVPNSTNPKDITLEKALKFLLSKDAKRCGRPKNKPKGEEAFEAM